MLEAIKDPSHIGNSRGVVHIINIQPIRKFAVNSKWLIVAMDIVTTDLFCISKWGGIICGMSLKSS